MSLRAVLCVILRESSLRWVGITAHTKHIYFQSRVALHDLDLFHFLPCKILRKVATQEIHVKKNYQFCNMASVLRVRPQGSGGSTPNPQNHTVEPREVPPILEETAGGYEESDPTGTASSSSVRLTSPPRRIVHRIRQLIAAHGPYQASAPAIPSSASEDKSEGGQIPEDRTPTPETPSQGTQASVGKDDLTQGPKVREGLFQRPVTPGPSQARAQNEEEAECIICRNSFSTRSTLQPCGHEFDFDCIFSWLQSLFVKHYDLSEVKCPLCRGAVAGIQHDHQPDGTFQTFHIESCFRADDYLGGRAGGHGAPPHALPGLLYHIVQRGGIIALAGPATLAPWERESSMSATAVRQSRVEAERRRLLDRSRVEMSNFTQYVDICVREGPFYVFITRSLMLKISQSGVTTRSKLIRQVQIAERYENLEHVIVDTSDESIRELERTKREVYTMLWRWLRNCPAKVQDAVFTIRDVKVPRDHRGIHSFLKSKVSITNTRGGVKIEWEVELEEEGPANADNDSEIHPYAAYTESRRRRIRYVKDATEQIQRSKEWFQQRQGDATLGNELDRATTNILEPYRPEYQCAFCHLVHRNGDCLLPWN